MPRKHFSIVSKFNLLIVGMILLTTFGTTGLLLRNTIAEHYADLLHNGAALAGQLARESEYAIYTQNKQSLSQLVESLQSYTYVAYARFTDRQGQVLLEQTMRGGLEIPPMKKHARTTGETGIYYSDIEAAAGLPHELSADVAGRRPAPRHDAEPVARYFDLLVPVIGSGGDGLEGLSLDMGGANKPAETIGYVQIGIAHEGMRTQIQNFIWNSLVAIALFVLLGMAATFFLTRRIAAPLRSLAGVARAVAQGNMEHEIKVHTNDEIQDLAAAFSDMLSKLKSSRQALEDHQFNLEAKVTQRTLELQSAKEEAIHLAHRAEEASRAKSSFLANMSHEIRTPLTAIVGFGETLLDTNTTVHERIDSINAIIRNGAHLQQIINDILDLSKIEAHKLEVERVDINYFGLLTEIESLAGHQAHRKGLAFEIDYRFPLPARIVTDPLRLKQILINLCNNAIKFTERGSVRVTVIYLPDARQMHFDVADTGIGLTTEQCGRLFQAFEQADASTTRKFGGTGLGLTISRHLAEMLGGTITAESHPKQGSHFTVKVDTGPLHSTGLLHRLPNLTDTPTTPTYREQLAGQILIAEDTPDNQRLFSLYIKKAGPQVTVVDNGQLAVDAALSNNFDLILMDMQMPVMDGIEAVKTLRRAGYTKPIVALTANAMKEDQQKCFQAGCDAFLAKPVKKGALLEMLARYLTATPPTQASQLPIYSKLLDDEPDMKDMVITYIKRLPDTLQRANNAMAQQKWAELKRVIHDIKGTGGAFGFPMLTDLATKIEFQIAKNDIPETVASVAALNVLCQNIYQGAPD